jgi:hypothetical protein
VPELFYKGKQVMAEHFTEGNIVELKKQHPCGSREWEILRTGMDFRIRCTGCSHQVMLSRQKFEKSVKKIIKKRIEESL